MFLQARRLTSSNGRIHSPSMESNNRSLCYWTPLCGNGMQLTHLTIMSGFFPTSRSSFSEIEPGSSVFSLIPCHFSRAVSEMGEARADLLRCAFSKCCVAFDGTQQRQQMHLQNWLNFDNTTTTSAICMELISATWVVLGALYPCHGPPVTIAF